MPRIGADVGHAARMLQSGQVVAFATETVYGLGALASDKRATERMYAMKGRPASHPCIIHIAEFSEAEEWALVPAPARKLAAAFMPGALTLLLPARREEGETVALRMPSHPQARDLLTRTGSGVFAPSANRFGHLSPTCAAHVVDEFPEEDDLYVLDGGDCKVGLESTIVSCLEERIAIVRPGAIVAGDVAAAAEMPLSAPPAVAAPGGMASHYAPRKRLLIAAPDRIAERAAAECAAAFCRACPPGLPADRWRRAPDEPQPYAQRLYAALRELDNSSADCIFVEQPPDSPQWAAICDRLRKAATPRVPGQESAPSAIQSADD